MLQSNGYFGVSDDKLEEIAETMCREGLDLMRAACACDIDLSTLTDSDKAPIRKYSDLGGYYGVAPSVRTGGSCHTGQAAPLPRNIQ